MTTNCRFATCDWSGSVDEIFKHCETYHPNSICEHKNNNYYDFTFDDVQSEVFLLRGTDGIYWFCLDPKNEVIGDVEVLKRGVFHIGQSEPIKYTLKLGTLTEGHAEYHGENISKPELAEKDNEVYELVFPLTYLESMNAKMTSRKMRLYVGDFDDSDDQHVPDSDERTWTASEEAINTLCLERFTCAICSEYIRRNARFCERKHFICLNCFVEMLERSKLKCPVCRSDYPYDCHDPVVEKVLKIVKFPDMNENDRVYIEPREEEYDWVETKEEERDSVDTEEDRDLIDTNEEERATIDTIHGEPDLVETIEMKRDLMEQGSSSKRSKK